NRTLPLQLSATNEKSAAWSPLTAATPGVSLPSPLFATVTVTSPETAPKTTEPKSTGRGVMDGTGRPPAPLRSTLNGVLLAPNVPDRVAVRAPTSDGLKPRTTVHLEPSGAAVHARVLRWKSPALGPVIVKDPFGDTATPGTVMVTVRSGASSPTPTEPKSSGLGSTLTVRATPLPPRAALVVPALDW